MRVRSRRLLPIGLAVAFGASSGACVRMAQEGDLEEVGLRNATSEPPPGLLHPVAPDDLVSVHDRGRLLFQLEKSLHMAYVDGLATVGDPGTEAVLPLVDVDPGGRSAQVVFVRWRPTADGQLPPLQASTAETWLLVSMLLTPDRVVDVEILQGIPPEGSHLASRIDAVVAAAEHARQLAPGAMFHLFDVYEEVPARTIEGTKKKLANASMVVGRVYALSADGDGPDLELVVTLPQRRDPAAVVQAAVVHEPGMIWQDPIRIDTATPGPITVARVMQRGLEAKTVTVQSPQGAWSVAAGTGLVQRADAPAAPAEPAPEPAP